MITLPESPGPAESQLVPIDFGITRQSEMGGAGQRINRTGNRWSLGFTLPPMFPAQAREWQAALVAAVRQGARFRLRQLGLDTSVGNAVLVKGAGQTGMTLNVDGMRPGGAWPRGAMISVTTGGRSYLHQLASAGAADAGGEAALPLNEMLRAVPSDNAAVSFAPSIEGLIDVDAATLTLDRVRLGSVGQITITEMA
jgi:hypothetical protein